MNQTYKKKDVSNTHTRLGGKGHGGSESTTGQARKAPEVGAESGEQAGERLKKLGTEDAWKRPREKWEKTRDRKGEKAEID